MASMQIRTVAFLDILGFKSKLAAQGTSKFAEHYESAINNLDILNQKLPGVESSLFPDHPGQFNS
jgi:hypothetical protein